MAQTSYALSMAAAYPGGHGQLDKVNTARNNTVSEIPYGLIVVFDTGTGTTEIAAKPPAGSTDVALGAVLYDHAHEQTTTGVPAGAVMNVASKGEVWCYTEQAVTPNDPVFCRFDAAGATGTNPAVGRVRKDADTAKAFAMTNARFRTSAAAGALVMVEFNLP